MLTTFQRIIGNKSLYRAKLYFRKIPWPYPSHPLFHRNDEKSVYLVLIPLCYAHPEHPLVSNK